MLITKLESSKYFFKNPCYGRKNGFWCIKFSGYSRKHENLSPDLQDYFDAYVSGEVVTNGKPAPDMFLKAAEKLSLSAENCVVVEDAVQGVEAGKAAGMSVVAVTTTRNRADLL